MHVSAWMLTISAGALLAACGFVIRLVRHRGVQSTQPRARVR